MAGELLAAAAVGSAVTGIPLLNSGSNWDKWVMPVYGGVILIAAVLSALCFRARHDIEQQRTDSIASVRRDLRDVIGSFKVADDEGDEAQS